MASGELPQTSDGQDIGDRARACLTARRPQSSKGIYWRLVSLEGTEDFGLDFNVHTAINQQVTDTFRLQLKGTTSPATDVANTYLAVPFKTSTLRLYARIPEPILIVVCDLSVAADAVDCPLYYVWAYEELQRIDVDSLPPDQKEATVRVPKENRLTSTLDVGPYVQNYLQIVEAGRALDVRVAKAKPALAERERIELIKNLESGFFNRSPALLDAIAAPSDGLWVEPVRGTLAWHLRQAQESLRTGKRGRAFTQLEPAEGMLPAATPAEAATYWALRGRTLAIQGEHDAARLAFAKAKDLQALPKHLSAWAESEMRARLSGDGAVSLKDLEDALQGDEPEIKSIRARVVAAQGRFDDAMAEIESFSGEESLGARAIVCTQWGKPELVLTACEEGLALSTDGKDTLRSLFLLLRARARFALATGRAITDYAGDYVPPSGVPGLDLPMLKRAWDEILEVVEMMDETGWPSNGEFVADIWGMAASMLGKQRETLPALTAAAKARPHIVSLQSAAESMAAQLAEYAIALEVNARIPDSDIKHLRRIVFLHQMGRHKDCVQHAEAHLTRLDRTHEHFGPAASLAAMSAQKILRTDLVDTWLELLGSVPELVPDKAVLDYMLAKGKNRLDTSTALAELERRYVELGKPLNIALALFDQLDPTDEQQATRVVEVATQIQQAVVLPNPGAVHYGTALATLKRWEDLLRFAQAHRDQFNPHARLSAFEALALDRLGRTAEARSVLDQMISAGLIDQMALKIYVNIMVRCGFTDEAKDTAERILEAAKSKREQIACLRLLFNLEQNSNPRSPRLLALAEQMGELTDRKDEVEEGVFLAMMLTATSMAGVNPTSDQAARFRARATDFFAKWPDSKIIRQAQIREDASPDELMATLNKLVGDNQERTKFRLKLENLLQSGTQPIPFAWRPRLALANVHDVVHLWEISKVSTGDDRKYHLTMAPGDWEPVSLALLKQSVPLLDLTALLVIDDLGVMDKLFELFPKIAVAQGTLEQLASLAQVFSGSLASWRCTKLRNNLKQYVDRIEQPSAEVLEGDNRIGDDSAEIAAICRTGAYRLYSDDLIFRIWASADHPISSMCTLDLLVALDESGNLSVEQVAQAHARLCEWHVGLRIGLRHQLAVLPAGFSGVNSVRAGIDLLMADKASYAIATAVWDVRGDFKSQLSHVSLVVRELVQQQQLPSACIASYVALWFLKTRLRTDVKWSADAILAGVAVQAVGNGPMLGDEALRKLWRVYLDLVTFHHGERMDEAKERQAIEMLAKHVAKTDAGLGSGELKKRFESGLTEGTADFERFETAYSSERVSLSVAAAKKGGAAS